MEYAVFRLLNIQVVPRPFVVLPEPPTAYPLELGAVIKHTAAPEDAVGWFANARALLNDNAMIATISAHAPGPGVDGLEYMAKIMGAIQNGFNCLNIVWWNDPVSRAVYRKWISGPPAGTSNLWFNEMFDARTNYGGDVRNRQAGSYQEGWYVPNERDPVIVDGTGGIIARATRDRWKQIMNLPNPNSFVQTVGLGVSTADGGRPFSTEGDLVNQLSVELQPSVMNRMWVMAGRRQTECVPGFAFPRTCERSPSAYSLVGVWSPDGQRAAYPEKWDSFFGQAPVLGNRTNIAMAASGPVVYLPYLRELVDGLVSRTPAQIIQDARAFVIFQNAESAAAAGGGQSFLRAALGANEDVLGQITRSDPTAQIAGQTIMAVGAAFSTLTYGISAVVGAVVGGAIILGDKISEHAVEGHGKDDLGRYKPLLERAWLSGNPNIPVPRMPEYNVESAPAQYRPRQMIILAPIVVLTAAQRQQQLQQQQSILDAGRSKFPVGKILIGTAAVVAGWQLWKRFGSKKS